MPTLYHLRHVNHSFTFSLLADKNRKMQFYAKCLCIGELDIFRDIIESSCSNDLIRSCYGKALVLYAGVAESDYGSDSEVVAEANPVLDSSQQVLSDADVNSHLVGKITFVQCSAGSAKSVLDASSDAVHGT